MKAGKLPDFWPVDALLELLYPLVPGAEEKDGAVELEGLNDGGEPAAGGGRGGSDA